MYFGSLVKSDSLWTIHVISRVIKELSQKQITNRGDPTNNLTSHVYIQSLFLSAL